MAMSRQIHLKALRIRNKRMAMVMVFVQGTEMARSLHKKVMTRQIQLHIKALRIRNKRMAMVMVFVQGTEMV